jgi:hypothetical protein
MSPTATRCETIVKRRKGPAIERPTSMSTTTVSDRVTNPIGIIGRAPRAARAATSSLACVASSFVVADDVGTAKPP